MIKYWLDKFTKSYPKQFLDDKEWELWCKNFLEKALKSVYKSGYENGKIAELERSTKFEIIIAKEQFNKQKAEAIKQLVSRLYGDITLAHKSWQFNEIEELLDIIQERLVKELKTYE